MALPLIPIIGAGVSAGLSFLGSHQENKQKKREAREHNRRIDEQQKAIQKQREIANLDIQQREAETSRMMHDNQVSPETMQAIANRWGHLVSGRTQMEGQYLSEKRQLESERVSVPKFNWGVALGEAALSAFSGHSMASDLQHDSALRKAVLGWFDKKNSSEGA
ncbi:MAG: hypothetical protein WC179_08045 [Candidatus Cloacimonadaceae bacterium]